AVSPAAGPGDDEIPAGAGGHGRRVLLARGVGVHPELRAHGKAGDGEALPEDSGARAVLAVARPDDYEVSGGVGGHVHLALGAGRIGVDPELGAEGDPPLRTGGPGHTQQEDEGNGPSSTHRRLSGSAHTQSSSRPLSSFSLYMYLMLSFRRRMLGSLARLTLM